MQAANLGDLSVSSLSTGSRLQQLSFVVHKFGEQMNRKQEECSLDNFKAVLGEQFEGVKGEVTEEQLHKTLDKRNFDDDPINRITLIKELRKINWLKGILQYSVFLCFYFEPFCLYH